MALKELVLMTHLSGSVKIASLADAGEVFNHFLLLLLFVA